MEKQYLDLLRHILKNGTQKSDRTGTGTKSWFGYQIRHDLSTGFPLLTTKKLHLKSVIYELLWFLKGETNIAYLKENGVKIWDEWANENGDLGPVYGEQWRSWKGAGGVEIDQITDIIHQLKTNPDSRRLIVSAWNVADLPKMALSPCHCLFQFETHEVSEERRAQLWAVQNGKDFSWAEKMTHQMLDEQGAPRRVLNCLLYQRSADVFLGVPFNIASYALLTMMIAQVVDMFPGDFIHSFGDVHIYNNHFEQVELQLSREPYAPPTMRINPAVKDVFNFSFEDFTLENYQHHAFIKGVVSV